MVCLREVGEKRLVQELTSALEIDERLWGGFGHDSAFLNIKVEADELLLLNTDRSGMNVAYKLGLADGRCVGDFAVSHAVSDILASGGQPEALSIALLLPPDLSLDFVKEVMLGAQESAKYYGACIAAGDTKHNPKFAMIVTVVGKCKRSLALTRSGAEPRDKLIAVGRFGAMLSGLLAMQRGLTLPESELKYLQSAVVYQRPPLELSRAIASQGLANACMDNSDGLASTLYELSRKSGVGVVLDKLLVPIPKAVRLVAQQLGVESFQLCLGSGDWQHIYAVPESNVKAVLKLALHTSCAASVIGEFVQGDQVAIKTENGKLYQLNNIENDRFGVGGSGFFAALSQGITYCGKPIGAD